MTSDHASRPHPATMLLFSFCLCIINYVILFKKCYASSVTSYLCWQICIPMTKTATFINKNFLIGYHLLHHSRVAGRMFKETPAFFDVCQSIFIWILDFVRLSLMSPRFLTHTQGNVAEISDAPACAGLTLTCRPCESQACWAPLSFRSRLSRKALSIHMSNMFPGAAAAAGLGSMLCPQQWGP